MKLTTTTDKQLKKEAKDRYIKLDGVFSKDEITPDLKDGQFIINLQSEKNGNGTHWIAMIRTPTTAFYFDSFGCIAPIEVANYLSKNGGKYNYNKKEIQDMESKACGYFCIDFLQNMQPANLLNFFNYIESFKNNTELNDDILKHHLDYN